MDNVLTVAALVVIGLLSMVSFCWLLLKILTASLRNEKEYKTFYDRMKEREYNDEKNQSDAG